MKLSFFICGVQKGGTTALDSFLGRHPSVQMAKGKEIHFFDDEGQSWAAPDYARLSLYFDPPAPDKIRGEATPIYSYWPNAMERLRAYNPDAKLILMLRHPVLRAFSHWRMETSRRWDSLPFSIAIRERARERVRSAPGGVHRVFSYVERGFYAPQIRRILALFPKDQVLFLRSESLWKEPADTLQQVQAFLGLENRLKAEQRYIAPFHSEKTSELLSGDADYLAELYAEDIAETQKLTGIDLKDWLSPISSYREPMSA